VPVQDVPAAVIDRRVRLPVSIRAVNLSRVGLDIEDQRPIEGIKLPDPDRPARYTDDAKSMRGRSGLASYESRLQTYRVPPGCAEAPSGSLSGRPDRANRARRGAPFPHSWTDRGVAFTDGDLGLDIGQSALPRGIPSLLVRRRPVPRGRPFRL